MVDRQHPVLVAACGNAMAGDDAFGPRVAEALRGSAPPAVQIVDLATKPASLLDYLPGPELLLIVDAAWDANAPVARLVDMDWCDPDRPPLEHDAAISSHGLSLADDLVLADRLGMLPKQVRLIACFIGSAQIGQPMQRAVCRQVPVAAARVVAHAKTWLEQNHRAKDWVGRPHA